MERLHRRIVLPAMQLLRAVLYDLCCLTAASFQLWPHHGGGMLSQGHAAVRAHLADQLAIIVCVRATAVAHGRLLLLLRRRRLILSVPVRAWRCCKVSSSAVSCCVVTGVLCMDVLHAEH